MERTCPDAFDRDGHGTNYVPRHLARAWAWPGPVRMRLIGMAIAQFACDGIPDHKH